MLLDSYDRHFQHALEWFDVSVKWQGRESAPSNPRLWCSLSKKVNCSFQVKRDSLVNDRALVFIIYCSRHFSPKWHTDEETTISPNSVPLQLLRLKAMLKDPAVI